MLSLLNGRKVIGPLQKTGELTKSSLLFICHIASLSSFLWGHKFYFTLIFYKAKNLYLLITFAST